MRRLKSSASSTRDFFCLYSGFLKIPTSGKSGQKWRTLRHDLQNVSSQKLRVGSSILRYANRRSSVGIHKHEEHEEHGDH